MASLILSGWAQPANALQMLDADTITFDYSDHLPERALEELKNFKHVTRVIGWSTGGALALSAIAQGILSPAHLTLIAAPYQFVSGNGVKGMDKLTFDQFRTNYETDPARTKTRFHALVAKGDAHGADVLKQLEHHPKVEETARWLPWLDYLGTHSLANATLAKLPPTLMIHGMNDAVVPHSQSQLLAAKLTHATVSAWEGVGHAPHLHDDARLRAEIAAHHNAKVAA